VIYTASFFKLKHFKGEAVSVANSCPDWFEGKQLKSFSPPWWAVNKFKKGEMDWERFTVVYNGYLDQADISEEMNYITNILSEGADVTLLCWEHHAGRCHRRLLAEWLSKKLKIELDKDNIR